MMESMQLNLNIQKIREQVSALPVSRNGKRLGLTHPLIQSIVQAFEKSPLGVKEYCKQVQVSQSAFRKWRKNSHLETGVRKEGINGFRKISASASQETFEEFNSFVLEGPQGLRMVGLSLSEVARVWRALC